MHGPFKIHPVLALFPEIDPRAFAQLLASVTERGILAPILVDQEQRTILHGRARVLAHLAAGRNPMTIPRIAIPANVRFEGVLDRIFSEQTQTRRMLGSDMFEFSLAARPFYMAEAKRREGRGIARVHHLRVAPRTCVA